MSNTLQAIHLLKDKLEVVLSNYESLKRKNEVLLQNNTKLQVLLKEREQELKFQKTNFDTLRVAKTIQGSNKNIRDTKLKINTLIREIDKCIIQLNS